MNPRHGLAVMCLACLAAFAAAPPAAVRTGALVNPDFEDGPGAGVPHGWRLGPRSPGDSYVAAVRDSAPFSGARSAALTSWTAMSGYASLAQPLDGRPLRGLRVRWTARVRYEPVVPGGAPGSASLWVRVDRAGGKIGFFDNMDDRPIRSSQWTRAAIVGEVDADAESVFVGLLAEGPGRASLDDVRFEVLADDTSGHTAPRRLGPRGLANLVAFTRLLGYVRHFHPSDEAAAADWERFTIAAVPEVEAAADARGLAATLQRLFAPYAPSATIAAGRMPARFDTLAPPPGATAFRAWRHRGYAAPGATGTYSSERLRRKLSARGPEDDVPRLGSFVAADLGGGVWCRVPHTVFADSARSLPAPTTPPSLGPRPEEWLPSARDRSVRLADVMLLWNVLQHFYPYWDVVEGDWSAALKLALERAALDPDAAAFDGTLERMVAVLRDGHGGVYHASEPMVSRPFSWDWVEGRLLVDAVRDSLAPGLRVGDEVVRIGARPVAEAAAEAFARVSAPADGWRRWRSLDLLKQGAGGDSLDLEVRGADGVARRVRVGGMRGAPVAPARPDTIAELRPGVWYVDLDRCRTAQFDARREVLASARAVVFDMRGYPRNMMPQFLGHLTDSTMTSARWNVPNVPYPDGRGRTFMFSNWPLPPAKPRFTGRVAFVIDGRAISYAETCMGIAEHYGLGERVGEPTAGTNGNVVRLSLPGRFTVTFTGMKVLKHDGSRHHGVGIRPTVPVSRTVAGVRAGRDELLERAIEVVTAAR